MRIKYFKGGPNISKNFGPRARSKYRGGSKYSVYRPYPINQIIIINGWADSFDLWVVDSILR